MNHIKRLVICCDNLILPDQLCGKKSDHLVKALQEGDMRIYKAGINLQRLVRARTLIGC